MTVSPPLVSAIVPVFNGEEFLTEAVSSILSQHHAPLEIIVVDDGSTDRTPEIARQWGEAVRYYRQANGGPAAARNRGLEEARGDIISFLDADDLWTPDKLEVQLAHLAGHPEAEVVVGLTQPLRRRESGDTGSDWVPCAPTWAAFLLGSACVRKSALERAGMFDAGLRYGEDVDWFLRARENGLGLAIIPEVTLFYRLHDGNMTRETAARDHDFLTSLKRSLDRRRVGAGPARNLATPEDLDAVTRMLKRAGENR